MRPYDNEISHYRAKQFSLIGKFFDTVLSKNFGIGDSQKQDNCLASTRALGIGYLGKGGIPLSLKSIFLVLFCCLGQKSTIPRRRRRRKGALRPQAPCAPHAVRAAEKSNKSAAGHAKAYVDKKYNPPAAKAAKGAPATLRCDTISFGKFSLSKIKKRKNFLLTFEQMCGII